MALTKTQVSELYVAIFNRASEGEGNQFWQSEASVAAAATAMLETDAAQDYFGSSLDTNQAFIEHIYLNTLGKTLADDPTGIQYWVDALDSGTSRGQVIADLVAAAQDPANAGAAQDQFLNRVAVSDYTADNLASVELDSLDDVTFGDGLIVTSDPTTIASAQSEVDDLAGSGGTPGGEPGDTLQLTEGRDYLTGTDNDDVFVGFVGQNQDGSLTNEFATGDSIDGGSGRDTIQASMINDNESDAFDAQAPRPYTQNVEEVYIEALEDVVLDATRMENVEEFWADFGRGDFEVNNVNLQGNNLNITKDVTFGIKDTQFGTDFTATFDSQSLLRAPEEASNSQLLIRIADVSTETPATPLANVSVTLGFELDGNAFTLDDVVSTDGSYQGLVTAIDAALAAQGLGSLNVTLSTPYEQVTVANNTVNLPFTAQEILITDPDGAEFGEVDFTQAAIESVEGGFLVAGNAEPVDPSVSSNLIESNLILDNAGRGSTAGDVQIGGESDSLIGVERFNVTVDRSSKIESLTQTATNSAALQEIYIDSMGDDGSLWIGAVDSDLNVINATAFDGEELSIGEGAVVSDLVSFNSAGSNTDVTFIADYDGDGRPSDAQAFTINTGSGDDLIVADLDGTSTSGSTEASLTINSTGGDNVVTLTSDLNDPESNTATVVLGSGADVVTGGSTDLITNTGGGNDVVYAENTGDKTVAQLDAGTSNVLAATQLSSTSTINGAQVLAGRTVQVTVAMPEEAPIIGADSFIDGIEVTAQIEASDGGVTTERDLYEAAAAAINEDPVANKLVFAEVDSNGHLIVSYLIDGASDTAVPDNMVELEVLGDWTDVSASNQNNLVSALQEFYQDSDIDATDVGTLYDNVNTISDYAVTTVNGTDSVVQGGFNVVNAGTGDDVVVLSSDDTTLDTLVFDQGGFGNDTVVHYNDVAGGDVLDFTAWLDNVESASGSSTSQVRIATSLLDQTAGLGAIGENDVVITQMDEIDGSTVAAVDFATLTTAQVLEALNTGASAAAPTANFVGNIQKSIVMIENSDSGAAGDNLGEYKVYEVSYDTVGGTFSSASLVGSVDFTDQLATGLGGMDDSNVA
ncbi:DUF4214 domain-containing protein [Marinobacter sp. F3R08]|uniref:DUF4214 domain-containing protein n=1 Tax=Marinobacter sp. F3R08 TaxID=2841559 RepID=UPI001C095A49|nr:DUF4214 domain-containing protein [Marinobacter sp. F3R08]MBU2954461.1 DUF4214 domain-containing protein [Marinobacter sp. F3R08]